MRELGETIRAIRKNLGLTTVEFGERIGVDNSAVSRYERNKLRPSMEVLLVVHELAVNDRSAQQRIEQEIAGRTKVTKKQLDAALDAAGEWIRKTLAEHINSLSLEDWRAIRQFALTGPPTPGELPGLGAVSFSDEARMLVDSGLVVPQTLTRIVQLYRQYGQSAEVRVLFRKALDYLEVEIGQGQRRAGSVERNKG